jgi:hypothetical protein
MTAWDIIFAALNSWDFSPRTRKGGVLTPPVLTVPVVPRNGTLEAA